MKKLTIATVLILSMMLVSAMPAQAALRLSAYAKARVAGRVLFTAKTSRPSRVKVTVYRGRKVVRRLVAHKSGRRYVAKWNRRDSSGRLLAAGTYRYKVTAVRRSVTRAARGKIKVRVPVPVTTPTPVPVPVPLALGTASRWIGFYQTGAPESISPVVSLEAEVGTSAAVVNFFVGDDEQFPATRVNAVKSHGSTPMITLEFWSIDGVGLSAINNGSRDAYIAAFADAAKNSGGTIWLRPLHEMNGNWYPWGGTVGSNSPQQLVAAWKRVHDIFVSHGATNVKFVWSINNNSCPDTAANTIESYYPGDAYVDYTAVDQYNFGTSQTWSHWTPFATGFADPYNRVTALTGKPLFISEIGCSELGGSKAAWVADMFNQIHTTYTKVAGVCWFNANKETDWRVESSTTSLAAFKAVMANGF